MEVRDYHPSDYFQDDCLQHERVVVYRIADDQKPFAVLHWRGGNLRSPWMGGCYEITRSSAAAIIWRDRSRIARRTQVIGRKMY